MICSTEEGIFRGRRHCGRWHCGREAGTNAYKFESFRVLLRISFIRSLIVSAITAQRKAFAGAGGRMWQERDQRPAGNKPRGK